MMESMTSLRAFIAISIPFTLAAVATTSGCEESTSTPDGGVAPGPGGGDASTGASDAGADATPCTATGTGTIAITVNGVPSGTTPKIRLTTAGKTADEVTTTTTLADRPAGSYQVVAERAFVPDPVV